MKEAMRPCLQSRNCEMTKGSYTVDRSSRDRVDQRPFIEQLGIHSYRRLEPVTMYIFAAYEMEERPA